MPIKKEIELRTFDELELEEQETLVKNWLDGYQLDDELDCQIEEFYQCLHLIGFDNVNISYSGFYSQGNGLSFTGKYRRPDKLPHIECNEEQTRIIKEIHDLNIKQSKIRRTNNFYSHESTVNSDDDKFIDLCRELMREFYKSLESEYDYYNSFEYVSNIVNDYGEYYDEDLNIHYVD